MQVPDFVDPVHGVPDPKGPRETGPSRKSPAAVAIALRQSAADIRRKPWPIADIIPMLLVAADTLEQSEAPEELRAKLARAQYEIGSLTQSLDTARAALRLYEDGMKGQRQDVKRLSKELAALRKRIEDADDVCVHEDGNSITGGTWFYKTFDAGECPIGTKFRILRVPPEA